MHHRFLHAFVRTVAALSCSFVLLACSVGDPEDVVGDDEITESASTPYDQCEFCCYHWRGSDWDWINYCDGNTLRIDGCDGPIYAEECGNGCTEPEPGIAYCQ